MTTLARIERSTRLQHTETIILIASQYFRLTYITDPIPVRVFAELLVTDQYSEVGAGDSGAT